MIKNFTKIYIGGESYRKKLLTLRRPMHKGIVHT